MVPRTLSRLDPNRLISLRSAALSYRAWVVVVVLVVGVRRGCAATAGDDCVRRGREGPSVVDNVVAFDGRRRCDELCIAEAVDASSTEDPN